MRSIRFTLLIYFLGLLAFVLVSVSSYVYGENRATLAAKERSVRELLQARCRDETQAINDKLDDELLHQAQTLASMAQTQWSPRLQFYPSLGALSSTPVPFGYLPLASWLAEDAKPALASRLKKFQTIRFAEHVTFCQHQGRPTSYFQISDNSGKNLQRSYTLGSLKLPLGSEVREKLELLESKPEDLELQPGIVVRCVTLRAPVTRERFYFGPPPARVDPKPSSPTSTSPTKPAATPRKTEAPRSSGNQGRGQPGAAQFVDKFTPIIFIQCARETGQRDEAVGAVHQRLVEGLASLQAESEATLQALRLRLALMILVVLAATVLGVVLLLRRGLAPVQRISHAVSQVSERDFQLRLKRGEVPRELVPIVEKLHGSLQSLEKAFAREKQAAADISHELRTPLSSLMATIQVCLRKPRASEEYRTALQTCNDIGKQLNSLVERLLTLARIDAGADTLRPEAVDVPDLAEQCVTMIRPLAEARELSLQLERNGPIVIETDPDKLREVVTNLLHNAIQYNRPHGRIDLSVARENGHVQLEVRDTGIGIPAAARAHLFERFYRADPSRQADTVHAGLGLAIIKGYLDLMGGSIEVESCEGQGSKFRVLLPVKPNGH
jgi:heavy metal sensor kinase